MASQQKKEVIKTIELKIKLTKENTQRKLKKTRDDRDKGGGQATETDGLGRGKKEARSCC